jgi:acyl-CoA synthetase (AMP-forming)/AMP-acid ligase II
MFITTADGPGSIDACTPVGSLVDLVCARAGRHPGRVAFRYVDHRRDHWDNHPALTPLTYEGLDRWARCIARRLRDEVAPLTPVLLMFPTGVEYIAAFFGALYAGVLAVPVAPPVRAAQWTRFRAVLDDAGAEAVLTTAAQLAVVRRRNAAASELDRVPWRVVDEWLSDTRPDWIERSIDPHAAAYLQYTSGSTAEPKGVVVTHANVLAQLADLDAGCQHDSESVGVSWLPHFHDMGLIYGILSPIFGGYEGILMSPLTFMQRPMAWLEALSAYRGTHTAAPDFAYRYCALKCGSRHLGALDLSRLRFAGNGAERVRGDTMERFARAFAPCGFRFEAFRAAYGLAEATLMVTMTAAGESIAAAHAEEHPNGVVGCGRPPAGTIVAIVDAERAMRVPDGETGEIWVSGPGVAAGYWRREEETASVFGARLRDTDEGPFLRTGDLGWVRDGQLFVAGRSKELVIVAGRNLHPIDLERTAEGSHPAVRAHGCAAFSTVSIDADDQEQLVIAAEIDSSSKRAPLHPDTLRAAIRGAIAAHHDVQTHAIVLVASGGLPRTSSGKIQRRACQSLFRANRLPLWTPPLH